MLVIHSLMLFTLKIEVTKQGIPEEGKVVDQYFTFSFHEILSIKLFKTKWRTQNFICVK